MEHLEAHERQEFWEKVQEALFNEQIDRFRAEFLELHPYDQARIFEEQPEDTRTQIYSYLSPEELSEMMENIDLENVPSYFSEMETSYATKVLADMSTDDAVDILNELDKNMVASFLVPMNKEAAGEIKELLHYEEKTAGSIMTNEFVVLRATQTIKEAMSHLRKEAPDAETIYYTYVIDEKERLVGVLSLRDLIIAEGDWLVSDVMSDRVLSVPVGEDQEEVAQKMRDYDFLALPVVDFQNHLLGIVTVDDVLDVMEEEANEDYSKFAGITDTDGSDESPFSSAKKRLPWLVILLFLGMMTASLISRFEDTLNEVAILAVFIPLIAGMGGNTGTQALAVAVRGIATGEFDKYGKGKMIGREAMTGLVNGLICGPLIMLIVYVWKEDIYLGLLVGISILATLIVATISGALIPMIMHRVNIDPAVASGPFITTINDIISILIYFGMATVFMDLLSK